MKGDIHPGIIHQKEVGGGGESKRCGVVMDGRRRRIVKMVRTTHTHIQDASKNVVWTPEGEKARKAFFLLRRPSNSKKS